jgi:predicted component of type VI protein secretion system
MAKVGAMTAPAKTVAEDQAPSLILEVQTSTLAGRRFAYSEEELTQGVMLGRGPECTLRFDANRDLKVSSKHALIIKTEDGVMLRDQYSSNGLYLNHHRVRPEGTRLYNDDEINLGYEGATIRVLLPKAAGESRDRETPKTMIMHGGNPPDVTPSALPKVPRTRVHTSHDSAESQALKELRRSHRVSLMLMGLLALAVIVVVVLVALLLVHSSNS